jgi:hypothetical protein
MFVETRERGRHDAKDNTIMTTIKVVEGETRRHETGDTRPETSMRAHDEIDKRERPYLQ